MENMLTGQSDQHINPKFNIHQDVVHAFQQLQNLAREEGIELAVLSGFRSFERQLKIWNDKVSGKRPINDVNSRPFSKEEIADMEKEELIYAILRWSALPGASRHHWGTDFDVYDTAALPENYKVMLEPEEYAEEGVFEKLGAWLEQTLSSDTHFGFFNPYHDESGGVSPEPWHISYRPLAVELEQKYSLKILTDCIKKADIELKEDLLPLLPDIYERFIRVDNSN